MTTHKGQTGTPRTGLRNFITDGCDARPEDKHDALLELAALENAVSHADAAGYARGLEDAAKVCGEISTHHFAQREANHNDGVDFSEIYGEECAFNAADECIRAIRAPKPAQDKGASHE